MSISISFSFVDENGSNSLLEKKFLEILQKSTNEIWVQLGNLQYLGNIGVTASFSCANGT